MRPERLVPGGGAPSSSLYSDVKPQISRDIPLKPKEEKMERLKEAILELSKIMIDIHKKHEVLEIRLYELQLRVDKIEDENDLNSWQRRD